MQKIKNIPLNQIIRGSIIFFTIVIISLSFSKKSRFQRRAEEALVANTTKFTFTNTINTIPFLKIYHVDSGRKFFTPDDIKSIIDSLSKNDYNYLELAIGNGGLRFLLDDMKLTIGFKTFLSDEVKAAINQGNKNYADNYKNEWNETEMNDIIEYARNKSIGIIPLLNSPGHMNSLLYACSNLSGFDCSYQHSDQHSAETIDLTNDFAVHFTKMIIKKYIEYFSNHSTIYFNLGGDEYANDILRQNKIIGFQQLINDNQYKLFVDYVNSLARMIKNNRMIPIAFNDGIYYGGQYKYGKFDKDIIISYWWEGYGYNQICPIEYLLDMGHKILNTNYDWYYVLAWSEIKGGDFDYKNRKKLIRSIPFNVVKGGKELNSTQLSGCMVCYWCDSPYKNYDDIEKGYVIDQIETFAESNTEIFTNISKK